MCRIYSELHGRGFPGGSVVKNPPANAGDMDPIPGLGRFHRPTSNEACALQLLSLNSRDQKLQLPTLWSPYSATREATTVRSLPTAARAYPPLAAAREKQ